MKPQVYKDSRPSELFDKYHRRVRQGPPDSMYHLVRMILTPVIWPLYRARSIGEENVPEQGPVILAPNHFSNMDHFFLGLFIRRQVQFMAKSNLFRFPIDLIMNHGGTFPVLRGRNDEEPFITSHAILDRGGVVGMYGEGGRSRSKQLGEPRSGLGRLALESGVPVVPVVIHGSQDVREIKRLRFPKVTIRYGEPIRFERISKPAREQCQRASVLVFERIRELHEALQSGGRKAVLRALRERQGNRPAGAEPELLRLDEKPAVRHGTSAEAPRSEPTTVASQS